MLLVLCKSNKLTWSPWVWVIVRDHSYSRCRWTLRDGRMWSVVRSVARNVHGRKMPSMQMMPSMHILRQLECCLCEHGFTRQLQPASRLFVLVPWGFLDWSVVGVFRTTPRRKSFYRTRTVYKRRIKSSLSLSLRLRLDFIYSPTIWLARAALEHSQLAGPSNTLQHRHEGKPPATFRGSAPGRWLQQLVEALKAQEKYYKTSWSYHRFLRPLWCQELQTASGPSPSQ